MKITQIFSDTTFNKKLLSLALPVTLQHLMLALVAAADALMLGKLNQDSMAAVSLATQIQFVQIQFTKSTFVKRFIMKIFIMSHTASLHWFDCWDNIPH